MRLETCNLRHRFKPLIQPFRNIEPTFVKYDTEDVSPVFYDLLFDAQGYGPTGLLGLHNKDDSIHLPHHGKTIWIKSCRRSIHDDHIKTISQGFPKHVVLGRIKRSGVQAGLLKERHNIEASVFHLTVCSFHGRICFDYFFQIALGGNINKYLELRAASVKVNEKDRFS